MRDVARVIREIPKRELEHAFGKTERLNLLVTPQQKQEIRATAERYGLSMTDYLIRIHALVEGRARVRRREGDPEHDPIRRKSAKSR